MIAQETSHPKVAWQRTGVDGPRLLVGRLSLRIDLPANAHIVRHTKRRRPGLVVLLSRFELSRLAYLP
jgi:hypothetical protein